MNEQNSKMKKVMKDFECALQTVICQLDFFEEICVIYFTVAFESEVDQHVFSFITEVTI